VPRHCDDIFVPILTTWQDRETKVLAVFSAYPNLPATWEVEDSIFEILFDVFGRRRNHATKLSAIVPIVAELFVGNGKSDSAAQWIRPRLPVVQLRRNHRLQ
jgi:hypothetical protein